MPPPTINAKAVGCRLIFVDPNAQPSPAEERLRYDTHENNPGDEGYRNFLSQLFDPLNERLKANSKGLEFGSGSGPTLSLMFEEANPCIIPLMILINSRTACIPEAIAIL